MELCGLSFLAMNAMSLQYHPDLTPLITGQEPIGSLKKTSGSKDHVSNSRPQGPEPTGSLGSDPRVPRLLNSPTDLRVPRGDPVIREPRDIRKKVQGCRSASLSPSNTDTLEFVTSLLITKDHPFVLFRSYEINWHGIVFLTPFISDVELYSLDSSHALLLIRMRDVHESLLTIKWKELWKHGRETRRTIRVVHSRRLREKFLRSQSRRLSRGMDVRHIPSVGLFEQRALRLLVCETEAVEALLTDPLILVSNGDRFLIFDV
ncbi:hypothetical protein Bca4012_051678 [Brassica carinata]